MFALIHPQAYVTLTDFGYPVYVLLVYLSPKGCKLVGFPTYRLWTYLMNVIPETRLAH